MLVYFLSIIDNIQTVFAVLSFVSGMIALGIIVAYLINKVDDSWEDGVVKLKAVIISSLIALFFILGAMLTPSRSSLIKSYLLVKGKQVLEHPDELIQKADSLANYIKEKHFKENK